MFTNVRSLICLFNVIASHGNLPSSNVAKRVLYSYFVCVFFSSYSHSVALVCLLLDIVVPILTNDNHA